MSFLSLLVAVADPTKPTPEERMQAFRVGLILIVGIGIVGILLIVAMLAAWRNFHKRIAQLEAERDERRRDELPPDAWREAGDRVEIEDSSGDQDTDDLDPPDDDTDLYGKDWEPGDDDDNPDERSW
ncbi:MAG: hypothetical protein AAGH99_03075 [Planctomycetota bacterium]